jgi:mono/diheme cytochrome c family protein
MVIGVNAVIHDILSHGVAIGLVAMITMAEYMDIRNNSAVWERFAGDLLKAAVIVITGIGAVTGVGIWFTTSALSPRGIGSMLRVFFWPWFIEWIIFTLEVIVIIIYYFMRESWKEHKKKYRVYFGSAYVLLASLSAFIITGILGFMLTSDGWPLDKSLSSAFFNPSFLPQLLSRLSLAAALGSLFATVYLLFSKRHTELQEEGLAAFGRILFLAIIFLGLSLWWYFDVVPSSFKVHSVFSVLTSRFSQQPWVFWTANVAGIFLIILSVLSGLKRSVILSKILVIPALIVTIGLVSEFERIREFIRGPYIIPGYMYSNQILLKENAYLSKEGAIRNAYWFNATEKEPTEVQKGAYLFGANCSTCHTIGGINDIRDRVKGRTEDGILVILSHTHDMVPFMPPFTGLDSERQTLAKFLYGLSHGSLRVGAPSRYTPVATENGDE